MATGYLFHPEALADYEETVRYYLTVASPGVADAFTANVEAAVAKVAADPERWPVVEAPEIRRAVLRRFPFVLYYRWEEHGKRLVFYAVMHCSREPGYWKHRPD